MKTNSMLSRLFVVVSILVLPRVGVAGEGYNGAIQIQTLLKTTADAAGRPIHYPSTDKPELSTLLVEIPAGQETGWHVHSRPCVAYVLDGEVAVETAGGQVRTFQAGDAFAEVVNLAHCGRNPGTKPVRILMVVVGEQGVPVSTRSHR